MKIGHSRAVRGGWAAREEEGSEEGSARGPRREARAMAATRKEEEGRCSASRPGCLRQEASSSSYDLGSKACQTSLQQERRKF